MDSGGDVFVEAPCAELTDGMDAVRIESDATMVFTGSASGCPVDPESIDLFGGELGTDVYSQFNGAVNQEDVGMQFDLLILNFHYRLESLQHLDM